MKIFKYLLEIKISRNSSQKIQGILMYDFEGLGVQMTTKLCIGLDHVARSSLLIIIMSYHKFSEIQDTFS